MINGTKAALGGRKAEQGVPEAPIAKRNMEKNTRPVRYGEKFHPV